MLFDHHYCVPANPLPYHLASSKMAQQFLEGLPKVCKDQLPPGATCMICWEEYGTVASDNGTIEHAVRLPCSHDVGSECIANWLSPSDGSGNACPMCMTVFFPVHLHDYDDEASDEEGGDRSDFDDSNSDDDGVDDEDRSDDSDEDGGEDGGNGNNDGDGEDGSDNGDSDSEDGNEDPSDGVAMTAAATFEGLASSTATPGARQNTER